MTLTKLYSLPSYKQTKGEDSPGLYVLPGGGKGSLYEPSEKASEHPLRPEEILPSRHRFSPSVSFFMGRRNAGKSLSMTGIGLMEKRRYVAFGIKHWKIATNYACEFADYQSPYIMDEISSLPGWARCLWCGIDEIQSAASNRRVMNKAVLNYVQFLALVRKRRIEVAFTSQLPQTIDPQVLYQVDWFIECEQIMGGRAVYLYLHDYWGQWSGNTRRKPWPPSREQADDVKVMLGTQALWPLYDTDQAAISKYLPQEAQERLVQLEWKNRLPYIPPPEEMPRSQQDEEALAAIPMGEAQKRLARGEATITRPTLTWTETLTSDQFQITRQLLGEAEAERIISQGAGPKALADYLATKGFTIQKDGPSYFARRKT